MTLFILFLTGLFSGAIDAIAGGGGLISLPVLLSTGVPPQVALGTSKLQSSIGVFIAARHYHRHGLVSLNRLYKGILFALIGSAFGAVLIQMLSVDFLQTFIPVLLIAIFIYTLLSPKLGYVDKAARISEPLFFVVFGFLFGFYDGFFGPAVGSFWLFAITFFLGYNLIKASACTKVLNFSSNLVAVFCFALGGNIDYRFAVCMAAGQVVGSRLGAHLAVKKGANVIRPVFLTVVFATIASLIYRNPAYSNAVMRFYEAYRLMAQLAIAMTMVMFAVYVWRMTTSKE